ncbi:sensor histidine kinase [Desulforamulus aquiferis]|uniref:sensor histidine kinase n=1 Tax=Desulforamulus aquiferis TaxID=1397668 RepID=UPI0027152DEC|nr:ATP-binding protein [Desulforamulus aquiferis]
MRLKYENSKTLKLIFAVPMLYYFMEYTLTVYTNLLYTGGAAIVEFMDAAVVIIYFVFTVIFLKTLYEKAEIKLEYMALRVMENSFSKEIEMLRESQMQAVIHRHDLRHHLSLLYGFAEGGDINKIKGYLLQAQRDLDKITPILFCENDTVNLVLSFFDSKAKKVGVTLLTAAKLPKELGISDTELCSALSNGLENAITAASKIEDKSLRTVRVSCSVNRNKLLVMIQNAYTGEIEQKSGAPSSKQEEHGFGCRSIEVIAEKRKGFATFETEGGIFTLRMVLPMENISSLPVV